MNRESLLRRLQSVSPGLTPKEGIAQSDCFVFTESEIITFNNEVAARVRNPLKEVRGAVKAAPLLALLSKLSPENVDIAMSDDKLRIRAGDEKSGIAMEAETLLPIKGIPNPKNWIKLPEDFSDAVSLVQNCASRDEQRRFTLSMIHLDNNSKKGSFIEASDNIQICRWSFKASFLDEEKLVKRIALRSVAGMGVIEAACSPGWLSFRNATGLTLSCQSYDEKYPSYNELLEGEGRKVHLPTALKALVAKAEIFTKNSDRNRVLVNLQEGHARIRGEGNDGFYTAPLAVDYKGKPLKFYIAPDILSNIVDQHPDVLVTPDILRVNGGSYKYISVLIRPEEQEEETKLAQAEPAQEEENEE